MKKSEIPKKNKTGKQSPTLQRAQAAELSRDYNLAVHLYRRLLTNEPDNFDLLSRLAQVYVRSGNDTKALELYLSLKEKNPANFNVLNNLGGIYRRLERYDESISVLEEARSLNVNNEAVDYSMGFTYKLAGEYEKATEYLMRVISEHPNDVLAYNHLGRIEFLRGNYTKAQNIFSRALQIDPAHPILNYNATLNFMEQKKYTQAKQHCEAALKAKPGWAEMMAVYADLLKHINDNEKAQKILEQAVTLNPEHFKSHINLGKFYELKKDYKKAENHYIQALHFDPDNISTKEDIALMRVAQNKHREAIDIFKDIEIAQPENSKILSLYVKSLMELKCMNEAMCKIKDFENKNPDCLDLLNMFSQYNIRTGNYNAAKQYLEKIQKKYPLENSYLFDNAEQYFYMGEFEESQKLLEKYLQDNPQDAQAWYLNGINYKECKKYRQAIESWKQAFELNKAPDILDDIIDLGKDMPPDAETSETIKNLISKYRPDLKTQYNNAGEQNENNAESSENISQISHENTNTSQQDYEKPIEAPQSDLQSSYDEHEDECETLILDNTDEPIFENQGKDFFDLSELIQGDEPHDTNLHEKSLTFSDDPAPDFQEYDPVEEQEYIGVDGFTEEEIEEDEIKEMTPIVEYDKPQEHSPMPPPYTPQYAQPQHEPVQEPEKIPTPPVCDEKNIPQENKNADIPEYSDEHIEEAQNADKDVIHKDPEDYLSPTEVDDEDLFDPAYDEDTLTEQHLADSILAEEIDEPDDDIDEYLSDEHTAEADIAEAFTEEEKEESETEPVNYVQEEAENESAENIEEIDETAELSEDDASFDEYIMIKVRKVLKESFTSPIVKDFDNTPEMFSLLKNLCTCLSYAKKQIFFENLRKENLEYVIERISGKPGLLSAANICQKHIIE